jgi:hypothetical protein
MWLACGRASESPLGSSEPDVESRRRDVVAALVLAVLVAATLFSTASYTLAQNNDTRAAATGAWSLGTRGTPVLPDHWPAEAVSWPVESDGGELRVNRFPGVLYWGAPFYMVSHLAAGMPEVPVHPYLLSYTPAAVAAVTSTTLAVVVSFFVFRRLVDRRVAFGAALVLLFATSTWSISGNALWTHGLTHLFLGTSLLLLASDRPIAAGGSLALSIFARPHTAIVAAYLGGARAIRRRSVGDLLRVGVPGALGLAAVVLYSWMNFKNPLPTSGYSDYAVQAMTDRTTIARLPRRIWSSLFHPLRGIVFQAPFLLILLPGIKQAWAVAPVWVRDAAVAGVAYQLLQLQLNDFDGGVFFFSYRLPLEMLVLAASLLLLVFVQFVIGHRLREVAFVVGASVAIGFQLVGVTTQSVEVLIRPGLEPAVQELCEEAMYECRVEDILP